MFRPLWSILGVEVTLDQTRITKIIGCLVISLLFAGVTLASFAVERSIHQAAGGPDPYTTRMPAYPMPLVSYR